MTQESTWEQRMADRARERKLVREAEERAAWEAAEAEYAATGPTVEEYVERLSASIDDIEAASQPHACACVGAPGELRHLPEAPCSCLLWMMACAKARNEREGK